MKFKKNDRFASLILRTNAASRSAFFAAFGVVLLGAATVLGIPATARATDFFVDSASGNDANDGESPENAWRSLEKVDAAELAPGDVVRFRRDRVWRGTLRAKSGAPGKSVVYSDYGDGEKPRILNAVDLSSPECWTQIDAQTWATVPDKLVELASSPENATNSENAALLKNFASGSWNCYTENGAKGASRDAVFDELDGARGYSLSCEASGSERTYFQWTTQNFPIRAGKTIAWTFRAKASAPVALENGVVQCFQTPKPWRSYGNVVLAPKTIGSDWAEYEIVVQTNVDADDARITFFLGKQLPNGVRLDFVPGAAREVDWKSLNLNADVGNLILTKTAEATEAAGETEISGTEGADEGKISPEMAAATKKFPPSWSGREFAGFKRWALDELKEPFDFWFDLESRRLFVRCDANPGETFASVEAALRTNTGVCNAKDAVLENLTFSHTGAHGISLNKAERCVLRNCDFDWIGGGDLYQQGGAGKRVRYGNGVEFWESSEDCVVEKCRFSRVYDVATTTQGPGVARSKNLVVRNCVMFDCEQAFEIWFTNPETTVEGLRFEGNVCVDCGRGWSHRQRPDKRGTALLAYRLDAKTVEITIRKNVFCNTIQWFVWFYHSRIGDYRFDDNVYWAADESVAPREEGDRFFWFDADAPKRLTFDEFRATTGQDANSRWIEPKFRDAARDDFELLNGDELDAGPGRE